MVNTYAVQSRGCRFESLWGFGFYLKGAHYEVDYSGKKTYLAGLQCTLTSSCAKTRKSAILRIFFHACKTARYRGVKPLLFSTTRDFSNQSRICGKGVGLSLFPSDSRSFESYEQFVRKPKKSKNDFFWPFLG